MKLLTKIADIMKTYGLLKVPEVAIARSRWFLLKRLSNRPYMCRKILGRRMYLDLRHEGISRTLAIWGIREADHTQLFKEELSEGMVVVDVGANIGYYTLIAASIVGPRGRVIAIEPDPRNFHLLTRNIEANEYTDFVEAHRVAVSDKVGTANIYLSEATNLNTLFDPERSGGLSNVKTEAVVGIETVSLDDLLKDRRGINFVRMDIEGFEVEAFAGMVETLGRSEPPCKILFEVHPRAYSDDRDLRPVFRRIIGLGFRVKTVVSAGELRPKQFAEFGYEPDRAVRDGRYVRGLYGGVSTKHVMELVYSKPKCVRYILLEK
jgi:FkbM family methyltransferase